MTISERHDVEIPLGFGVKVGVSDVTHAVWAAGVNSGLDFGVGVPFHAAHEELASDLTVVVAHELLGSPGVVVEVAVHFRSGDGSGAAG